ncbi:MAG: LamG domain-containing protein, partial [Patescibacteria group bacterium]|nr:LamG domain-containing protein [Patescibacteria group bacterium]
GNNPSLNITDAITVSAWVKRTSDTPIGWKTPLHRGPNTSVGSSMFFIGLEEGANYQIVSTIGAGSPGIGWTPGATGVTAQLDTWYYVVNSWDGIIAKVYVNGVKKTEYALASADFVTDPSAVTRIGASGDATGYLFNGSIDDVRIYNRALSAGEVEMLYDRGR